MKTGTKIALGIVAVLLLGIGLFIYGGTKMFGDEINAIRSLRQIEEGVYTYSFKGDYGFNIFATVVLFKGLDSIDDIFLRNSFHSANSVHNCYSFIL